MKKLLRITTVSLSLDLLLKGQLKFLSNYFEVVGVASGIELLNKVSQREGIRVINLPMERDMNILKDLVSLFKMTFLIHKEKPYIVHSNTPKGSLIAMIAAFICRVPHRVYNVTGLRFETEKGTYRKILILMEKITCLCATKVIPEGEGVKNTLLKEKITKKPLKKIFNGNINGVDMEYFNHTPEVLKNAQKVINKDVFTFVYIGRLSRSKGINELLSAFKQLINSNKLNKPVRLLLVGSIENDLDPLFPETLKLIRELAEVQLIEGWQDDIRPYLAASDALVFPSYREGFPNVVLQAGAMGLPSIVTDINGCNEIIIEGTNGIIIPPRDKDSLYNAMLDFVENPQRVTVLAKNARNLIKNRYEQKQVWEALLKEYKSLY